MSQSKLERVRARMSPLDEDHLNRDPFAQFAQWFDDAIEANIPEPTAMSLATVDSTGQPAVRIVLLKSFDERGFVFYTNYGSRKAQELEASGKCAVLFHWTELERQVRIEGLVSRVSREESVAYFRSRARESQIGAWASKQSRPLDCRETLEFRTAECERRFEGREVLLPDWWGGYRLTPTLIEFWQGIAFRLHDRFVFTRDPQAPSTEWISQRLNP